MPNTTHKTRSHGRTHNGHNYMTDFRNETAALRSNIRDLAGTAKESAVSTVNPLQSYVRENPWQSMLIAAGIGVAAGFLFGRR